MKTFLKRVFIFLLPVIVTYITLIFIIDPFNYFNICNVYPLQVKKSLIPHDGYILWNVIQYSHNPEQKLLLGDSRVQRLDTIAIRGLSGERYYNFGMSGGNASSTSAAFWFAESKIKLKKVYIGISFYCSGGIDSTINPMRKSIARYNSDVYFFKNEMIKISFNVVLKKLTELSVIPERKAIFNEQTQWKYFLETFGYNNFKGFKYQTKNLDPVKKISEYCKANNIELNFIIFPQHADMHKCTADFNLLDQEIQFKNDVAELGNLFDYDYDNEITADRTKFQDPFHSIPEVTALVVADIWGKGDRKYMKYTPCTK